MFRCGACSGSHKLVDTVKLDVAALPSDENLSNASTAVEEEAKEHREEEAREQLRLQQEQELLRREEERRQLAERLRAEAEEQTRAEEQARLEQARLAQARLEQERLERQQELERLEAEQARREERAQRQREELAAARKEQAEQETERHRLSVQRQEDYQALQCFLAAHRFSGANSVRKIMFKFKYPLHTAVKLKDTNMIRVLLAAKADPTLTNSAGETPYQLAARLFKNDERTRARVQEALVPRA